MMINDVSNNISAFSKIEITCEEFVNNLVNFNETIKKMIESYLSDEEIEEINNPKTKRKRINQLIEISNQRMLLEVKYNENIRW